MNNWDERFIELANHISQWSKDKSRKVGAVIVNPRHAVVSTGWNGFPRGVNDNIDRRHERPAKYLYTAHAEANAIYNAASLGVATVGCTLYASLFPCASCAIAIIQSGIERVVCPRPNQGEKTYEESWKATEEMLEEAGVVLDTYTTKEELERKHIEQLMATVDQSDYKSLTKLFGPCRLCHSSSEMEHSVVMGFEKGFALRCTNKGCRNHKPLLLTKDNVVEMKKVWDGGA